MARLVRQLNTDHVLIDSATAPLLARMRSSLSSALGRPIEDGDPEMVAAASLLPYFGQGLAAADIASKSMLLQFATGEDLEAIGAHYGVARRTLHATMEVSLITLDPPAPGRYVVSIRGEAPDGTLFSYVNSSSLLRDGTRRLGFTLACEATGDAYNGLDALINPVFSLSTLGGTPIDVVELEVLSASRGGGPEIDDVYASRVHDTLLARTVAGSKAGYEALARTVEGVYDAAAIFSPVLPDRVSLIVIAPTRAAFDVQAEIEASPLLPLGLAVSAELWFEAERGQSTIYWYTPTGGDADSINAAVAAALDAALAPLYYTYMARLDLNLILCAVTSAGGVGASISGVDVHDISFAVLTGYMTEHTFAREYMGVSEWI